MSIFINICFWIVLCICTLYMYAYCLLKEKKIRKTWNMLYLGKKNSSKFRKFNYLYIILLTIIQEITKHMLIINYYMSEYKTLFLYWCNIDYPFIKRVWFVYFFLNRRNFLFSNECLMSLNLNSTIINFVWISVGL